MENVSCSLLPIFNVLSSRSHPLTPPSCSHVTVRNKDGETIHGFPRDACTLLSWFRKRIKSRLSGFISPGMCIIVASYDLQNLVEKVHPALAISIRFRDACNASYTLKKANRPKAYALFELNLLLN